MWYIYAVEYNSAIKRNIGVISRDVDGPRVCHMEWSKLGRGEQISSINAYMWNLENWYRWTYLQGRNIEADIENGHVDMAGWGRIRKLGLTCTTMCKTDSSWASALNHRGLGGRPTMEGGYMYTYSWLTCCKTETITLQLKRKKIKIASKRKLDVNFACVCLCFVQS